MIGRLTCKYMKRWLPHLQEDPDILEPRTFVVCKWVATCIEEKSHGKGHSMSTWQEFALMPCKSVLIIMDTQIKFGSYVVMTLGCKLRIVGKGTMTLTMA